MRNEHNMDVGVTNNNAFAQSFRNKLHPPAGTTKATRNSTAKNLGNSIKYFEKRLKDYEKAIRVSRYFLEQVTKSDGEFNGETQIYWTMAFDPCSQHSEQIFLSLDRVFESLRDKFSSLEIGE